MEQDDVISFLNTDLVWHWYHPFCIFHIQSSMPTFCKLQDKKLFQCSHKIPPKNKACIQSSIQWSIPCSIRKSKASWCTKHKILGEIKTSNTCYLTLYTWLVLIYTTCFYIHNFVYCSYSTFSWIWFGPHNEEWTFSLNAHFVMAIWHVSLEIKAILTIFQISSAFRLWTDIQSGFCSPGVFQEQLLKEYH